MGSSQARVRFQQSWVSAKVGHQSVLGSSLIWLHPGQVRSSWGWELVSVGLQPELDLSKVGFQPRLGSSQCWVPAKLDSIQVVSRWGGHQSGLGSSWSWAPARVGLLPALGSSWVGLLSVLGSSLVLDPPRPGWSSQGWVLVGVGLQHSWATSRLCLLGWATYACQSGVGLQPELGSSHSWAPVRVGLLPKLGSSLLGWAPARVRLHPGLGSSRLAILILLL